MESILQKDVLRKSDLQFRLGLTWLDQGEALRAAGHDPRAAAERGRQILRRLHADVPRYPRMDQVVAALGHAALLRCDAEAARAWLARHVERYPRAPDRARALAVLAALDDMRR